MTPGKTTPIDVNIALEGGYELRAGTARLDLPNATKQEADDIIAFTRRVYALGRSDARAEVGATLRGLLSL